MQRALSKRVSGQKMTAPKRISATVARLLALSRPTFVDGTWRRPALGKMQLAKIRKRLVANGEFWPPKPLRDRSKDKPFKLSKWERERPAR